MTDIDTLRRYYWTLDSLYSWLSEGAGFDRDLEALDHTLTLIRRLLESQGHSVGERIEFDA